MKYKFLEPLSKNPNNCEIIAKLLRDGDFIQAKKIALNLDVNGILTDEFDDTNVLIWSSYFDAFEVFEIIINKLNEDEIKKIIINESEKENSKLYHFFDIQEILEKLINKLSDFNFKLSGGNTLLMIYAELNRFQNCCESFLNKMSDEYINLKNGLGFTAFEIALKNKFYFLAELIFDKMNSDLIKDILAKVPEFNYLDLNNAILEKKINLSKFMLNKLQDGDLNKIDEDGGTLLHLATSKALEEISKFLIDKMDSSNLKIIDKYNKSALNYAASKNLPNIVKLLLEKEVKIDFALWDNIEEKIKLLLISAHTADYICMNKNSINLKTDIYNIIFYRISFKDIAEKWLNNILDTEYEDIRECFINRFKQNLINEKIINFKELRQLKSDLNFIFNETEFKNLINLVTCENGLLDVPLNQAENHIQILEDILLSRQQNITPISYKELSSGTKNGIYMVQEGDQTHKTLAFFNTHPRYKELGNYFYDQLENNLEEVANIFVANPIALEIIIKNAILVPFKLIDNLTSLRQTLQEFYELQIKKEANVNNIISTIEKEPNSPEEDDKEDGLLGKMEIPDNE